MESRMPGDCAEGISQALSAQAIRADEHPGRLYLHHLRDENLAGIADHLAGDMALIERGRIVDQHAYMTATGAAPGRLPLARYEKA